MPDNSAVTAAWEAYDAAQPEPPFDENHHRYHTPADPVHDCAVCVFQGWAEDEGRELRVFTAGWDAGRAVVHTCAQVFADEYEGSVRNCTCPPDPAAPYAACVVHAGRAADSRDAPSYPDWLTAERAAGDSVCRHPSCDCLSAASYRAGLASGREACARLAFAESASYYAVDPNTGLSVLRDFADLIRATQP